MTASEQPEASFAATGHAVLDFILSYVGEHSADDRERLRAKLQTIMFGEGRSALEKLGERLLTTGSEFTYFPRDPLAKCIHEAVAEFTVTTDSMLEDGEKLKAVRGRPAVFLSNHLSYSDANLFSILLDREGFHDIADRLTVIAGPKVYSDPMRRFASLCFGTIKTPQSTARSSEEAVMSVREVARIARETIEIATQRQREGDALLLFVEGTRSRSAAMQRALPAVARYLEDPISLLVPIGVVGSERFVPVGEERVHPARVAFRIGNAVPVDTLSAACDGDRRLTMDAIGAAIAHLLPDSYRGVYGETEAEPALSAAATIARSVFGADTEPDG